MAATHPPVSAGGRHGVTGVQPGRHGVLPYFYGWVILAAAVLLDLCTAPGHSTGMNIFLDQASHVTAAQAVPPLGCVSCMLLGPLLEPACRRRHRCG